MRDEYDDASGSVVRGQVASDAGEAVDRVPRLISRLYATSDESVRARMLGHLLRPLGSLGLVAIAAGAFAGFLQRRSAQGIDVSRDDVARYTSEQVAELARFVGQVSPEALQSVANLLADNPVGVSAFSAAVLMLLLKLLRSPGRGRE